MRAATTALGLAADSLSTLGLSAQANIMRDATRELSAGTEAVYALAGAGRATEAENASDQRVRPAIAKLELAVHEIGQSAGKKIARVLLNVDAFMKHELQIVDAAGVVQLSLVKPRALLKAQLQVNGATGQLIGSIAVKLRLGKARFNLIDAAGTEIGTMNAENFRAWNFSIADASGTEVAKVTKTWEGLGKAMFTNADNYVLQILSPISDPLHSLVVASALGIDLILKQAKG